MQNKKKTAQRNTLCRNSHRAEQLRLSAFVRHDVTKNIRHKYLCVQYITVNNAFQGKRLLFTVRFVLFKVFKRNPDSLNNKSSECAGCARYCVFDFLYQIVWKSNTFACCRRNRRYFKLSHNNHQYNCTHYSIDYLHYICLAFVITVCYNCIIIRKGEYYNGMSKMRQQ